MSAFRMTPAEQGNRPVAATNGPGRFSHGRLKQRSGPQVKNRSGEFCRVFLAAMKQMPRVPIFAWLKKWSRDVFDEETEQYYKMRSLRKRGFSIRIFLADGSR